MSGCSRAADQQINSSIRPLLSPTEGRRASFPSANHLPKGLFIDDGSPKIGLIIGNDEYLFDLASGVYALLSTIPGIRLPLFNGFRSWTGGER